VTVGLYTMGEAARRLDVHETRDANVDKCDVAVHLFSFTSVSFSAIDGMIASASTMWPRSSAASIGGGIRTPVLA
jgi:hypothetical protein